MCRNAYAAWECAFSVTEEKCFLITFHLEFDSVVRH